MALEHPDFRVIQQLGVGAGSKIYKAVELKTGRTVSVKHIVRKSADDDRFLAQAEAEYEISSKLDHPVLRKGYSLIRVRRLLQVKELLFVMECVDGLDLENARPNRLKSFLSVFHQVATGLGAMHEAGYLHTDIKPTNIMVAQGGTVKIIDFGQACKMNHRKDRIQGTPDYIAPEQVRRMPLDQRTDVFNLGATMYWVLTSEKYPTELQGLDAQPGKNVVQSKKPIAPIELNDKIPTSLSQLVMECCRKNPADRPDGMKQVIGRLAVVQKLWSKFRESKRSKAGMIPPPSANSQTTVAEDDA